METEPGATKMAARGAREPLLQIGDPVNHVSSEEIRFARALAGPVHVKRHGPENSLMKTASESIIDKLEFTRLYQCPRGGER